MKTIAKPQPNEHGAYYSRYIDRVPDDGRVIQHMQDDVEQVMRLVRSLPDAKLGTPHAPGEWTVKDILVHMADAERIFAYRALRIARGDATPLPGFEQDDYVPNASANERAIDDILAEYAAVRAATVAFFISLDEAALVRLGTASDNPLTARAAAYIIAGHELHHLKSIKENYG